MKSFLDVHMTALEHLNEKYFEGWEFLDEVARNRSRLDSLAFWASLQQWLEGGRGRLGRSEGDELAGVEALTLGIMTKLQSDLQHWATHWQMRDHLRVRLNTDLAEPEEGHCYLWSDWKEPLIVVLACPVVFRPIHCIG